MIKTATLTLLLIKRGEIILNVLILDNSAEVFQLIKEVFLEMENLRNLSRWGMFAFLSVALCTSFVGCSDDDPDYSNVTPPTVSVSHSISGRVTGMDGNGLSATVSMNGESTQTGADGTFTFDDVDAGSYTLTASAPGKHPLGVGMSVV